MGVRVHQDREASDGLPIQMVGRRSLRTSLSLLIAEGFSESTIKTGGTAAPSRQFPPFCGSVFVPCFHLHLRCVKRCLPWQTVWRKQEPRFYSHPWPILRAWTGGKVRTPLPSPLSRPPSRRSNKGACRSGGRAVRRRPLGAPSSDRCHRPSLCLGSPALRASRWPKRPGPRSR